MSVPYWSGIRFLRADAFPIATAKGTQPAIWSSRGFSMVELVMVTAIVGVLSAVAVPLLLDQATKARIAALEGLARAVRGAVALTQLEYRLQLGSASASSQTSSLLIDNQAVSVQPGEGNPAASKTGIGRMLHTLEGFSPSYQPPVVIYTFTHDAPKNCNVVYNAKTSEVLMNTQGC